jgi:hypothetical protein
MRTTRTRRWARLDGALTGEIEPPRPSEPGELGVRLADSLCSVAEVDEHARLVHRDHTAQTVPVMGDLVAEREFLDRPDDGRGVEGASGQIAPLGGAGWVHHFQYAPVCLLLRAGRAERSSQLPTWPRRRRPVLVPLPLGMRSRCSNECTTPDQDFTLDRTCVLMAGMVHITSQAAMGPRSEASSAPALGARLQVAAGVRAADRDRTELPALPPAGRPVDHRADPGRGARAGMRAQRADGRHQSRSSGAGQNPAARGLNARGQAAYQRYR